MRVLSVLVAVPLLVLQAPACAAPEKKLTWEEAEVTTSRSTGNGPRRTADDFHSDDACVAEADRLLSFSARDAHELMRGCLHREDFMLLSLLREARWKRLKIQRSDWQAVMRAELRRGSIADVDLEPYGLPSTWLRAAPSTPAPGDMFLLHAETVRPRESAGKPGLIVHPIIYGTRDQIFEYEQHWDLVHVDRETGKETVVQKDVKVTREREKTGRTLQQAQVVKHPVLLQLDEPVKVPPGTGILCVVDKVRAGSKSKSVVYDDDETAVEGEDESEKPLPIRQVVHVVACVSTSG